MKKLVKLDPISKRYMEFDHKKLHRITQELLCFIRKEIPLESDIHGIWSWVVPLCEGVLSNKITEPIPYEDLPLKYQIGEGSLSEEFEDLYAPFANCITGTPTVSSPEIEISGVLYTYAEFED